MGQNIGRVTSLGQHGMLNKKPDLNNLECGTWVTSIMKQCGIWNTQGHNVISDETFLSAKFLCTIIIIACRILARVEETHLAVHNGRLIIKVGLSLARRKYFD